MDSSLHVEEADDQLVDCVDTVRSTSARSSVHNASDSDDESLVIDVADLDSNDEERDTSCERAPSASGVLSLVSKALASDVSNVNQAARAEDGCADTTLDEVDRSATQCCICGEKAAYRCPGCERRTCSMTCVRAHKADFQCSGERNVATKIPLANFTDHQLQRDYHFLEECRTAVANAERSFPHMWRYSFKALPPPLYALRTAAKKRGVLCQITSEGMQKRDSNTSRYDRKTDTIIWHCEFRFHRRVEPSATAAGEDHAAQDHALPEPEFVVATDWASERHHLGSILDYCWATNPPLPCFHINRRYNRAAARKPAEGEAENEQAEGEGQSAPQDDATPSASADASTPQEPECDETVAAVSTADTDDVATAETPTTTVLDDSVREVDPSNPTDHSPMAEEEEDNDKEAALLAAVAEEVVPLTPDEVRHEFLVRQFLSAKDAVILCKAERLGTTTRYFRLDPKKTLNECLRVLFFVNEYPVLDVVHEADLESISLVTDADREAIRASFKPKEKPVAHGGHGVPRKKSELTEEEQHALARVPCRMHLGGQCRQGDECPYWHCTFDEVPACRSFVRDGQCPKGERCSFRHDDAAIRAARKRHRSEDGAPNGSRRTSSFGPRGGRGGRMFGRGAGRGGGRGGGRGRGAFQR